MRSFFVQHRALSTSCHRGSVARGLAFCAVAPAREGEEALHASGEPKGTRQAAKNGENAIDPGFPIPRR